MIKIPWGHSSNSTNSDYRVRSTSTPCVLWQSPAFSFHIHSVCVMTITSILVPHLLRVCYDNHHHFRSTSTRCVLWQSPSFSFHIHSYVCYDNHQHSRSTSTPCVLWQSPAFSFHFHSVCVMTITIILVPNLLVCVFW
jgi:uncharacterized membrane protein